MFSLNQEVIAVIGCTILTATITAVGSHYYDLIDYEGNSYQAISAHSCFAKADRLKALELWSYNTNKLGTQSTLTF